MTTAQLTLVSAEPVQRTRNEADMIVRQHAHAYVVEHGLDNGDRLDQFTLDLSSTVGRRLDKGWLWDVIEASGWLLDVDNGDRPHRFKGGYEEQLNASVNGLLDVAGFPGSWLLRSDVKAA